MKKLKTNKLRLDAHQIRQLTGVDLHNAAGGMMKTTGLSCEDCPASQRGCTPTEAQCGTLFTVECSLGTCTAN